MHPIIAQFQVFGKEITIGSYGLMAVIAVAAAVGISSLMARRFHYSLDDVVNYTLLTAVGGLTGAFTVGFLLFLPQRIAHGFFSFPPALVSWGGIIGGLTAMAIIMWKWRLDFFNFADILSPGFFIAIGIGRIGCHLAGCCFGRSTLHGIGVTFSHHLAPASHMPQPVIPTQLISSAILITIGILFIPFVLRRETPGACFAAMLLVYPLKRFFIEFYRADARAFLFGLSDGQLFSVASFILGISLAVYVLINRHRLRDRISHLHRNSIETI